MKEGQHVDGRLQAWLDGELPEAEAEEVRRHVKGCACCSEEQEAVRAVLGALRSDAGAEPMRPMWPAVRARIAPGAKPRFGFSFGLGTALAAAAGLIIGIALGTSGDLQQTGTAAESQYEVESLLDGDSVTTLDEVYVSAFAQNAQQGW